MGGGILADSIDNGGAQAGEEEEEQANAGPSAAKRCRTMFGTVDGTGTDAAGRHTAPTNAATFLTGWEGATGAIKSKVVLL